MTHNVPISSCCGNCSCVTGCQLANPLWMNFYDLGRNGYFICQSGATFYYPTFVANSMPMYCTPVLGQNPAWTGTGSYLRYMYPAAPCYPSFYCFETYFADLTCNFGVPTAPYFLVNTFGQNGYGTCGATPNGTFCDGTNHSFNLNYNGAYTLNITNYNANCCMTRYGFDGIYIGIAAGGIITESPTGPTGFLHCPSLPYNLHCTVTNNTPGANWTTATVPIKNNGAGTWMGTLQNVTGPNETLSIAMASFNAPPTGVSCSTVFLQVAYASPTNPGTGAGSTHADGGCTCDAASPHYSFTYVTTSGGGSYLCVVTA